MRLRKALPAFLWPFVFAVLVVRHDWEDVEAPSDNKGSFSSRHRLFWSSAPARRSMTADTFATKLFLMRNKALWCANPERETCTLVVDRSEAL